MPSPSPSSDPSDPSDPSARAAARQAVRRARAPEVDTSPRLRAASTKTFRLFTTFSWPMYSLSLRGRRLYCQSSARCSSTSAAAAR